MGRKIKTIIFIAVLAFSVFIRLFDLGRGRCLNWDEVSFIYNSYSILETGKDEYGERFPLQFKSTGDYKAPLYIYLSVPIVKYFGLNEFSVRFLPSLLGGLSVGLLFFIVFLLFENFNMALISMFFVSISPWHIQFTKAGADVGVSTFFVLLALLGFLALLKNKNWGKYIFPLGAGLAFYSYFSDRVFLPLFVGLALLLFKKNIIENKKKWAFPFLLLVIFLLPLFPVLVSSGHIEKFMKTTVFGYSRTTEYVNLLKSADSDLVFFLFHNPLIEALWGTVNKYLNHFSFSFLFFKGSFDDPRQLIYRMGVMYLFDLPLIVLGIIWLLKRKEKKAKLFLLAWILAAPIPAAITKDPFHARRSYNLMYPLLILSSIGLNSILTKLKTFNLTTRIIVCGMVFTSILFFFCFYLASYYIWTPPRTKKGPSGWQCGYKELVEKVSKIKGNYDKVVIDTSYQGPYIYFLFYQKYPPAKYQPQASLFQESEKTLGEGVGYDNYEFRKIYWPKDRCLTRTLFAGPPDSLPVKDIKEKEAEIIDYVYFFDGEEAFRIVEVQNPSVLTCRP